ncbi:hypothetical protein BD626DRAFT_522412 [Schizophyllum amplum]|uniref:Uncharacterized protein n=1 Tax=Schizophyllum amplum TaxID=97359 RepID=A0A550BTA8_9AGAR|nr:hypothetical protein BD626DRAFT_522412 [Auriculariopsis ampla]
MHAVYQCMSKRRRTTPLRKLRLMHISQPCIMGGGELQTGRGRREIETGNERLSLFWRSRNERSSEYLLREEATDLPLLSPLVS